MPRLCQLALFDATDKSLFLNIKTSIEVSRQTNMMENKAHRGITSMDIKRCMDIKSFIDIIKSMKTNNKIK